MSLDPMVVFSIMVDYENYHTVFIEQKLLSFIDELTAFFLFLQSGRTKCMKCESDVKKKDLKRLYLV